MTDLDDPKVRLENVGDAIMELTQGIYPYRDRLFWRPWVATFTYNGKKVTTRAWSYHRAWACALKAQVDMFLIDRRVMKVAIR